MVWIAADFAGWLIGVLADTGRRKITGFILGTDQERELRSAASAAVERVAVSFRPGDEEHAEQVAMVIRQVFSDPMPTAPPAGHSTVLEALQAGISRQLAVLDDARLTGIGRSSADLLGLSGVIVARELTRCLVEEIVLRGSRGGPLFPLASQLNDDFTHLQGQRIEDVLGNLASEVREALLRLDRVHAVAAVPVALAQLPPKVAAFSGRETELGLLAELLDPSASAGQVVVSAVAGMAGVGKTTLAVEAGHAARQRGWFSGGVLFIDLHGYDDVPTEPTRALEALLRALGVPGEQIPPTLDERTGLYRSMLSRLKGPVLIIADNVSSESQVRRLQPGVGPHKVLITSRKKLAGLEARLLDVTVLANSAALELLDRTLRFARPDDSRVSGDGQGAFQLVQVAGGLPLALQIIAAILKGDPVLSTSELAGQLSVERERLGRLHYDDGSGAGALSVAAAFELSYRRLNTSAAQLFRLLPVNPGPDVSTTAVAVLADLAVDRTRGVLGELAKAHLVEVTPGTVNRWRMHDLVRLYAQRLSHEHGEADGREQALDRLLNFYLDTAQAATSYLRVQAVPTSERFTSRDESLSWLDAERASLVAAVTTAADAGRDHVTLNLPVILVSYFSWRRYFDDCLGVLTVCLRTVRRLGHLNGEGLVLNSIGEALRGLRRFEEAIAAYEEAAGISLRTGDLQLEGIATNNLGLALQAIRQFGEAIIRHQAAAVIFRTTNNRLLEGTALHNLAMAYDELEAFPEAIEAYREDLAICQEIGDRHGEGLTLNSLGISLRQAGRLDQALVVGERAAAIFREVGHRHDEGMALNNLAATLDENGNPEKAITIAQAAVAILRETGDLYNEANSLLTLSRQLTIAGQIEDAITASERAASLYREASDRHGEAQALINLGAALQTGGRLQEAMSMYWAAAAIHRETGDQHGEQVAMYNIETAIAAMR